MLSKEQLLKQIAKSASPDKFIKQLVDWGVLTEKQTGQDYAQLVSGTCRHFVPWFVLSMASANKGMQKDLLIHEGSALGKHHVWIEYNDYYIDGTIAQFLPEAEKMLVIKKEDATEWYGASETYSIMEWLQKEEASPF